MEQKLFPDIKETFNIEFSKFSYLYRVIQISHCKVEFTPENIKDLLQTYRNYKELRKKDWEEYSSEEKEFSKEWATKFSDDFGNTVEDKEFKYLKPGDYFEDDRILIINTEEKYLVTMTEYGYVRIYLINSCYSASKATGLVNYKL